MRYAILAFLFFPLCAAGETGNLPPFDGTLGHRPRPGDWLEYRVAFRADPLESRLAPDPAEKTAGQPRPDGDPETPGQPSFEAPEIWRTLPLRLEIVEIADDGMTANMTFAGLVRATFIPFVNSGPRGEFRYDEPQPPPERTTCRVDGFTYEAEVLRRHGDSSGFARMTSPDLPFGLARFATPDVDFALVATGSGQPPAFPAQGGEDLVPAPGRFYRPPDE